jgi:hypothetical protein
MKILVMYFFVLSGLQCYCQSVGINTDGSSPSDPTAMLEIKKGLYSKLKIRSLNFSDTSVLELSNRTMGGAGTDFRISAIREQGLYISSVSDLVAFNNDSIMTMRVNGNIGIGTKTPTHKLDVRGSVRISSLSGTGSRQVHADANGLLSASSVVSYYNVGPGSFAKLNSSTTTTLFNHLTGAFMNVGSTETLVARVNLPHGATVTSMRVFFLDNSVHDLQVKFYLTYLGLPGSAVLNTMTISGSDPEERTAVSAISELIENDTRFYYIAIGPVSGDTWDSFHLFVKGIVFTYEL